VLIPAKQDVLLEFGADEMEADETGIHFNTPTDLLPKVIDSEMTNLEEEKEG